MIWPSMKNAFRKIISINRCIELAGPNMDPLLKTHNRGAVIKSFPKFTPQTVSARIIKTLQTTLIPSITQVDTTVKSVARVPKIFCRWLLLCLPRASQEVIEWFSRPTQIRSNCRVNKIKGRITTSLFLPTRWIGLTTLQGAWPFRAVILGERSCTR